MKMYQEFNYFLVDDDIFSMTVYAQFLENLGCKKVSTFSDSTSFLNTLTEQPDVVFLDHNIDNLTGVELLKKVKRFNPNIYVVFISGQEDVRTAVEALKYGAFDYIVKGDNEEMRIQRTIERIEEVETLMRNKKPKSIKNLLSFFI